MAKTNAEHMETSAFRRIFKAFQYRDFRLMWFGACTSSIGTWMQIVAQGWLIYRLSHSAFLLALDQFLGGIPIFLFSLIGGVVADRLERRKILLVSQYVQMTTAILLTLLVATGLIHVWQILCLSFCFRTSSGLRRAGVPGADPYLGQTRGHAERHRAEFDPVQHGGDHWTSARGHSLGKIR